VFSNVGFFGNLTNSDLATETLSGGPVTSEPASIESASVDGQPCAGVPRNAFCPMTGCGSAHGINERGAASVLSETSR